MVGFHVSPRVPNWPADLKELDCLNSSIHLALLTLLSSIKGKKDSKIDDKKETLAKVPSLIQWKHSSAQYRE